MTGVQTCALPICLDFGVDDGPLDATGGRHHLLRARVQIREVLEVVGETIAQILRLADVDDAVAVVHEAVHARRGRNVARRGSIRRRICHAASLRGIATPVVSTGVGRAQNGR